MEMGVRKGLTPVSSSALGCREGGGSSKRTPSQGMPASQQGLACAATPVGPRFLTPFALDRQGQHGVHTQCMLLETAMVVSFMKHGGRERRKPRLGKGDRLLGLVCPELGPSLSLRPQLEGPSCPIWGGICHHLLGHGLWVSSRPGVGGLSFQPHSAFRPVLVTRADMGQVQGGGDFGGSAYVTTAQGVGAEAGRLDA